MPCGLLFLAVEIMIILCYHIQKKEAGFKEIMITKALREDLAEILALQKEAYLSEAEIYNDFQIPPMTQTLEGIGQDHIDQTILKKVLDGKIVGSIRAYEKEGVCYIGKVIVHPEYQNRGIGKELMKSIEQYFSGCDKFSLFTGSKSGKNLYFYGILGYRTVGEEKVNDRLALVYLEKNNKSTDK